MPSGRTFSRSAYAATCSSTTWAISSRRKSLLNNSQSTSTTALAASKTSTSTATPSTNSSTTPRPHPTNRVRHGMRISRRCQSRLCPALSVSCPSFHNFDYTRNFALNFYFFLKVIYQFTYRGTIFSTTFVN